MCIYGYHMIFVMRVKMRETEKKERNERGMPK